MAQQSESLAGVTSAVVSANEQAGSADSLKARVAALEAQQDISAEEKAKIVELLNEAVAAAERADALTIEAEKLSEKLRQAPARQAEIREALALAAPTLDTDELMARTSVAEAEKKLREIESTLMTIRQRVQTSTDALGLQRQRPELLQSSLAETRASLAKVDELVATPPSTEESAGVAEARQLALDARQRMRNAEVALFEQELSANDQLVDLFEAELELAQREVEIAEGALAAWQTVVQRQQENEAEASAREAEAAKAALAEMPKEVLAVAEQNAALAKEIQDLADKEADITAQLARAESRLKEVEENFTDVQERVQLAGLNDTIALVLRKQRDALPKMRAYRSLARKIQEETGRAADRQFDSKATTQDLAEPTEVATRIVDAIGPPVADSLRREALPHLIEALQKQRELATALHEDYGRYIKQLGKLDNAERALVAKSADFSQLIDEHLLWIRSAPPVSSATLAGMAPALGWFTNPKHWMGAARDLRRSVPLEPVAWLVGLLAFILAFALRGRARNEFATGAADVGNVSTDSLSLTMRALVATIVLAAAWPLIGVVIGWPLFASVTGDPFSRAVGGGLLAVALIGFGFSFLNVLVQDAGVGDKHFGWPSAARQGLCWHLRWLAIIVLPLGFVIWMVETYDDEAIRVSLGRVAFVLAMLALSIFLSRVLRPQGALLNSFVERHPGGLITKLRYVWMPVAVAAPLSLALLSVFGYHYSAVQLQDRLQATAWIVIALLIVSESLMRWLYVTHRRLAYQRALDEQEQTLKERAQAATSEKDGDEVEEVKEPEIDLEAIQTQTGSLIRTVMGLLAIVGLWVTWSAVLPALGILDDITLWRYPGKIEGVDGLVSISLADAGLALLFGVLTYVGTKNLPGALELAVLNRTSLDAGAKYAFTTLSRYVIAGAGIILIFNHLGMEWSRLQWMVAALSVGLGFGLQEIVANFISGIILLFERPIRVGDVVTIDSSSGTVSRIQIRATTITDWDRKEFIVPNKRFITGNVLNWTLSNELNRIIINVGSAYGADTEHARALLVKVAQEHPRILNDPAPIASFEGFGDNSLNLVLRCYMPNLDGRVGVITDLHSAIDSAFKEAGIEIAFPQRDIHVDAKQPLKVQLSSEEGPTLASKGTN